MAKRIYRALAPLLGVLLVVSSPVSAQFSTGYKFLEAVRKRDGTKVNEMLGEPGTTVVNTRDVTTGETALHIVTAKRDLTWMSFLLAKGANANARDARGGTPLVAASNMGFVEGVQVLLENGARIDEPNAAGETPLIAAVHRRDVGMMRILLKAGADPDRADNSGRSARDYAMLDGHNSNLVTEITTNARPRAARTPSARSYGPTL